MQVQQLIALSVPELNENCYLKTKSLVKVKTNLTSHAAV